LGNEPAPLFFSGAISTPVDSIVFTSIGAGVEDENVRIKKKLRLASANNSGGPSDE